MNYVLRRVLDLIYPRRAVCAACGSRLGNDRDDVCDACLAALADSWVGARQVDFQKTKLSGAAYAHYYHGAAGGMARNLKYRSVRVIADQMAKDIARAAHQLDIRNLRAVTAVPMHPKRLRLRGFNHAELLARGVAREMNAPYHDLLIRTRNAQQQARLDHDKRLLNLKDAFAVPDDARSFVEGGTFLLVDDVWTTGATAINCAIALRNGGASHVYFAAYATGEKEHKKRKCENGKYNQRQKSNGTAAS